MIGALVSPRIVREMAFTKMKGRSKAGQLLVTWLDDVSCDLKLWECMGRAIKVIMNY